jgi:hypothetical protein
MANIAGQIRDLEARLRQQRQGSEAYWGIKGQLSNLRRIENAARSRVHNHGIAYQTLACGCTWDAVLHLYHGSWSDALAFWDDARQWEHHHPNTPHHAHEPPAQYAHPGYGQGYSSPGHAQQADDYNPYNDPSGYPTFDGDGYYYVVDGTYWPMYDHHGRLRRAYRQPEDEPSENPAATPRDERDERVMSWAETQKAWQQWKKTAGDLNDLPDDDDDGDVPGGTQ